MFSNFTIQTVNYKLTFQLGEDGLVYVTILDHLTGYIIISNTIDSLDLWELAKSALKNDPRKTEPVDRRKMELAAAMHEEMNYNRRKTAWE